MGQKAVTIRFFYNDKLRVLSRHLRNVCGKRAGADANVNSTLGCMLAYLCVKLNFILSKLSHVA